MHDEASNRFRKTYWHAWAKEVPIPASLHTTKETRIIGLKHCALNFDMNDSPSKYTMKKIYENEINARRGRNRRSQNHDSKFAGFSVPFELKAMMHVDLIGIS